MSEPASSSASAGSARTGIAAGSSAVRSLPPTSSGILLAFCVTQLAFSGNDVPGDRVSTHLEVLLFAITLPAWIVLARMYGLYSNDEQRADHSGVDDLFGVFNMLTVGAWLLFAVSWATGFANPSFPKLALFWVTAIALVFVGRTIARAACRRTDAYVQNTLIVGAGHVGQRVARKLLQHPEYGVNVVGFVDDSPRERGEGLADLTVLGTPADLPALVEALDVERVIVAFLQAPHAEMLDLVRELNGLGVQVDVVPRLFDAIGSQVHVHAAEGLPLLGMPPAYLPRSSLFLKRALDLILSSLGLMLLSPLFAAIARGHQARLARAGALPSGAHGSRRDTLRDPQVPHHDRRCRLAEGGGGASEQAPPSGRRRSHVQDSSTTRG